jgi:hypothetical protein
MALSNHGVFPSPESQFKKEDDLPRMAKSRKMTYREWANPDLQQAGISTDDLMKPAA